MGFREQILKKIFTQGIESVDRGVLAKLFKGNRGKLYHYDPEPKALMEEGFDRVLKGPQGWKPASDYRSWEDDIQGLYWADRKKDLPDWISHRGKLSRRAISRNTIEGLPNPKTRYDDNAFYHDTQGMDFVGPDEWKEFDIGTQIIQLKPKQMLAKYGDLYRILGLAAALGITGESE